MSRRPAAVLAAALLTAWLAGCGLPLRAPDDRPAASPDAAAPADTAPPGEATRRATRQTTRQTTEPTNSAPIKAPPAVAPRTFSAAELDPGRLIAISPDELSELLGDPGFVRREASAEVWQYRAKNCVLDVFLYLDPNSFRVTYFEFRSARHGALSQQRCFEDLLRRKVTTRGS